MKTALLICVFTISFSCQGIAQVAFGVGVSNHTHFFQHDDRRIFDNARYQPSIANSLGLNAYFEWQGEGRFQFRLNTALGEKKIVLASKFRLPDTGGRVKATISHRLIFADVAFLSVFNLSSTKNIFLDEKKSSFFPILGFHLSLNQYLGKIQGAKISNNGVINQGTLPAVDLTVEDYPFVIGAGISLGTLYKFNLKKRHFALQALLQLSPSDFFSDAFTATQPSVKGKYHYLSLGMYMPLIQKK